MNKKIIAIIGGVSAGIIGIGAGSIYLLNQFNSEALYGVANTGLDQLAIRQMNAPYEPYLNRKMTSTELKQLIDLINYGSYSSNPIQYNGLQKGEIENDKYYYAEAEYTSKNGLINKITTREVIEATIKGE